MKLGSLEGHTIIARHLEPRYTPNTAYTISQDLHETCRVGEHAHASAHAHAAVWLLFFSCRQLFLHSGMHAEQASSGTKCMHQSENMKAAQATNTQHALRWSEQKKKKNETKVRNLYNATTQLHGKVFAIIPVMKIWFFFYFYASYIPWVSLYGTNHNTQNNQMKITRYVPFKSPA